MKRRCPRLLLKGLASEPAHLPYLNTHLGCVVFLEATKLYHSLSEPFFFPSVFLFRGRPTKRTAHFFSGPPT